MPASTADSNLPLGGLTVAEFGEWIAVPFAGKLLADLGADVVKYERSGRGDATRRWGPFPPEHAGAPEFSSLFAFLNTSKRSRTVADDASPAAVLRAEGRAVDVALVDPAFLGEQPEQAVSDLRAASDAVVVALTPFGLGGPYGNYRGYDITASAAGGISYGVGERDRPPLPLPFAQSDRQAALCAVSAALMGVLDRQRRGTGQLADLSVQEVMAALHCGYFLPRYIFSGGVVGLRHGRAGGAQPYPHTVLPCKDGLVTLVAPKLDQWLRFLDLMGNPAWAQEPRYRNRRAMQWEYKDEVDALVMPWFADKTKAELLDLFLRHRIPFAPIMDGHDLADSEHLRVRSALAELELPGGGRFVAPTVPYRFSRSRSRNDRAPRLGEHGHAGAGAAPPVPRPGTRPAAESGSGGPLAGVRVLDLGTAWAGGIAGRILGDYGADVIKIESWSHMDGSRMGKPIVVDDDAGGDSGSWPDLQPGFHVHGRSKRSVTINLRSDAGQELLLALVAQADVLIHNFTPRVARSLGLEYDRLSAANDRLILIGQSVAGDGGPLSDYTGYASTVASLAGLAQGIGYEHDEPVASVEGIYTDVISATATVYGVLVALLERQRSGRGQQIDVSQWEALMSLAPEPLLEYSATGGQRVSEGFKHPLLCPHGNYPVLHDPDDETQSGAWVSIAVGSDAEWHGLLEALREHGRPEAGSAGWTLADRHRHRAAIDAWLTSWTQTVDVDTAQRHLQAHGVAAFRVANIADVFVDEQLVERGTFISVEHPLVGIEPMPGLPWNYSDEPCEVRRRAPLLGEHTREVLAELLGVDDARYSELVASQAVETRPERSDE